MCKLILFTQLSLLSILGYRFPAAKLSVDISILHQFSSGIRCIYIEALKAALCSYAAFHDSDRRTAFLSGADGIFKFRLLVKIEQRDLARGVARKKKKHTARTSTFVLYLIMASSTDDLKLSEGLNVGHSINLVNYSIACTDRDKSVLLCRNLYINYSPEEGVVNMVPV